MKVMSALHTTGVKRQPAATPVAKTGLPSEMPASQLAQSQAATAPLIDLRASVPIHGGRFYVTILAGQERRNSRRLMLEGQTHWSRRLVVYLLLASILLAMATGYLVILYLIKSALGINVFTDSSPLHFIYELFFT